MALTTLSDSELLVEFRNPVTKEKAFTSIIKKYQEKLYWHLRRMVVDHDDANDVLQNVMIRVWNGLDKLSPETSPSAAAKATSKAPETLRIRGFRAQDTAIANCRTNHYFLRPGVPGRGPESGRNKRVMKIIGLSPLASGCAEAGESRRHH